MGGLGGGGIKSSIQTRAVMYLHLFHKLSLDYSVGLQTVMLDVFLLVHCSISDSNKCRVLLQCMQALKSEKVWCT